MEAPASPGSDPAAARESVQATSNEDPSRFEYLRNMGAIFLDRFDDFGNVEDINKSISAYENAVQVAPKAHTARLICLHRLGVALFARFDRLGDITDLSKAISAQEEVLEQTPDGHPDKASRWNNLGNSLHALFKCIGNIAHLDRAVTALNRAASLISDDHPTKAGCLASVGVCLHVRFHRLKDVADLDKSILALDQAVHLISGSHTQEEADHLVNLGVSLRARFRHLGRIADLDKAISAQNQAVHLTSSVHENEHPPLHLASQGHTAKASHWNSLGVSLRARFDCLGTVKDLNDATSVLNQAVSLTIEGHQTKAIALMNLGSSLRAQFKHNKEIATLAKAIQVLEEAIHLIPEGHSVKAQCLTHLGLSYYAKFRCFGAITNLHKAIHHLSIAAQSSTSPARIRFAAAQAWAICAEEISLSSSLDAYHCALDLISHIAWLGLSIGQRHKELSRIGNVICKAVATAITSGNYHTAVEWLEQGRSVVWGQILKLRTPIDELQDKEPALAEQLTNISMQLDQVSTQDLMELESPSALEESGQQHRQLALRWDSLINSVRAIPGFEDFLQPKKISKLRNAARSGSIVIINVYRNQCDALILKKGIEDVIHVPLPQVLYSQVQRWQNSLKSLTSDFNIHTRSTRHMIRQALQPSIDQTLEGILEGLWIKMVEPILKKLEFTITQSHTPPRIWWCATGPLTFLPFHAAGLYNKTEVGYKITDFVTSSYTPTLTALLETSYEAMSDKFQLLAIIQPSTPGAGQLSNTIKELAIIKKYARMLSIRSLEGPGATKEHVITGMKDCSWVHLACHGVQNTSDPTSSALLLQDGPLKLSEIIRLYLPKAKFAFLSACQTAVGDHHLSEESVHLAAGMLLAGYHGIIATMWSIMDSDAPIVTEMVYAELFEEQQPNSSEAAYALHHAVQHLRETGAPFLSWVPFIHVGM